MGYITWIILGALSGWIASIIMGKGSKMGAVANVIVGVAGAFIGGFVFNILGARGVTGLNIRSVIVSVIGACILLYVVNKIKRWNFITNELNKEIYLIMNIEQLRKGFILTDKSFYYKAIHLFIEWTGFTCYNGIN